MKLTLSSSRICNLSWLGYSV